jgi:hypothetical protein
VSVSTYTKVTPRTRTGLCAGKGAHPVRGFFDNAIRWRCPGFCHGRRSGCECTHPVGARSHVAERIRAALSAGALGKSTRHPHHPAAGRRCSVGDGGRLALCRVGHGHWRNLGRTTCIGFHGHAAVGHKGRGKQAALLAGAPGGCARSECRAKPLAHRIAAVAGTSARPPRPRRSALAGGVVPIPTSTSRHMGGHL